MPRVSPCRISEHGKVLNKAGFSSARVTQPTEYAKICLDRILNMPRFWIWKGSEYARIS